MIIYVYGAPGAGKTTFGRELARRLGADFYDLDAEIVSAAGRTVPEIFAADGEAAFRALEAVTLRKVTSTAAEGRVDPNRVRVIALGGGTLLNAENREWCERHGVVYCLETPGEAELAERLAKSAGSRPLGNRAAERAEHYASFPRRIANSPDGWRSMTVVGPGPRRGEVTAPPSKSQAHRLLIANFLAGERGMLEAAAGDGEDVLATKRCLKALAGDDPEPELDCGESGSTLRFLAPVAAALGKRPKFIRRGRLAVRPFREYGTLAAGVHELPGDVSSQFVTGLLFALPLLKGDSEISFTSPLESRGYVEMTLRVLGRAGIEIARTAGGFRVPGGQTYRAQPETVEGDWSGSAFWYGMNALGSDVRVSGLDRNSAQPDRAIAALAAEWPSRIDVSQYPDLFPVLAVIAAAKPGRTEFTGIGRLRLKESDRVAAMRDVLTRFGVRCGESAGVFTVEGTAAPFAGGGFRTFGDHRIAMAIAVGAVRADAPVVIDDAACVGKSYSGFFRVLDGLTVPRESGRTAFGCLRTAAVALALAGMASAGRGDESIVLDGKDFRWKADPVTSVWTSASFHVPASWKGGFVRFCQHRLNEEDVILWVNGEKAGEILRPAGEIDVSKLIRAGETNTVRACLTVTGEGTSRGVTAAPQFRQAWRMGPYSRPVLRMSHGPVISDVFANTSWRKKELALEVEVKGTGKDEAGGSDGQEICVEVKDRDGRSRQRIPATGSCSGSGREA